MSQVSLPKSIADNIQEAYEILLNEHKALEEEHAEACASLEPGDHLAEAVVTIEKSLRLLETLIGIK